MWPDRSVGALGSGRGGESLRRNQPEKCAVFTDLRERLRTPDPKKGAGYAIPDGPAVLACDPSLTAWGWAVLQKNVVRGAGVIVTKPLAKKRKIREGDDRVRRTNELVRQLNQVIDKYNVIYIVSENQHGSQNARAAIGIGITVAVLESINVLRNIPVEWFYESDAKKALLGRISASKAEVKDSIDSLYDVYWLGVKYHDEAVADALAIYYCAECHSPTIRLMNQ